MNKYEVVVHPILQKHQYLKQLNSPPLDLVFIALTRQWLDISCLFPLSQKPKLKIDLTYSIVDRKYKVGPSSLSECPRQGDLSN